MKMEKKMLYIAPEVELLLFMPMEGIAYDDGWLRLASDEDDGVSVPVPDIGGGEDDGEEAV